MNERRLIGVIGYILICKRRLVSEHRENGQLPDKEYATTPALS